MGIVAFSVKGRQMQSMQCREEPAQKCISLFVLNIKQRQVSESNILSFRQFRTLDPLNKSSKKQPKRKMKVSKEASNQARYIQVHKQSNLLIPTLQSLVGLNNKEKRGKRISKNEHDVFHLSQHFDISKTGQDIKLLLSITIPYSDLIIHEWNKQLIPLCFCRIGSQIKETMAGNRLTVILSPGQLFEALC